MIDFHSHIFKTFFCNQFKFIFIKLTQGQLSVSIHVCKTDLMISDIVFLYILVCIYVYLCYYTITNIADYSSSIQHVEPSDSVSESLTKLKTCHTCGKCKQTKGKQMHVPNPWSNASVVLNGSLSEATSKK